jgi:hypothetical protein
MNRHPTSLFNRKGPGRAGRQHGMLRIGREVDAVVGERAAGRHGCRFPLVKRHRMRTGAGNPVTELKRSFR